MKGGCLSLLLLIALPIHSATPTSRRAPHETNQKKDYQDFSATYSQLEKKKNAASIAAKFLMISVRYVLVNQRTKQLGLMRPQGFQMEENVLLMK